jgi:hypothetical protein
VDLVTRRIDAPRSATLDLARRACAGTTEAVLVTGAGDRTPAAVGIVGAQIRACRSAAIRQATDARAGDADALLVWAARRLFRWIYDSIAVIVDAIA